MDADAFYVRCDSCRREIAIRSVSEFHNVGGFRGYSFGYACECGAHVEVDGREGDDIPESMKLAAAQRSNALVILRNIDFQRRSLSASAAKSALRDARMSSPEPLGNDVWLVYRADDWSVTFSADSKTYALRDGDSVQPLSDIDEIAANLPVG